MSYVRCSEDELVKLGCKGFLEDVVGSIFSVLSLEPVHQVGEVLVCLEGGQCEGDGNPVEDCLSSQRAHCRPDGVLLFVCLANTVSSPPSGNLSTKGVIISVNKLGDLDQHLD